MDKRYQIFLSSTYQDLQEERLEVLKVILELDCFPCSMEYFPAANEEVWEFIKDLIDECDYYIIIIAGKYGSTDDKGVSYTQKEYEYALSKNIPIIAFVHNDLNTLSYESVENDKVALEKLRLFREQVQKKMCKQWSNAYELGAVVSRSLTQLIKRNPQPGWVRSNSISSSESITEILKLKTKLEEKEEIINSFSPDINSNDLSQGDDEFTLEYNVTFTNKAVPYNDKDRHARGTYKVTYTWNELLLSFASYLMPEARDTKIKNSIASKIKQDERPTLLRSHEDCEIGSLSISESTAQRIIVQFKVLGYIEFTMLQTENAPIRMAKLTKKGERYLFSLQAVKKNHK